MLGSIQDAEDALQEAVLAAWRGLGTFAGSGSLRAWLYLSQRSRVIGGALGLDVIVIVFLMVVKPTP